MERAKGGRKSLGYLFRTYDTGREAGSNNKRKSVWDGGRGRNTLITKEKGEGERKGNGRGEERKMVPEKKDPMHEKKEGGFFCPGCMGI